MAKMIKAVFGLVFRRIFNMKIQLILSTIGQTSRQYFASLTDKYCPLTAIFIIALSFLSPSLYADPLPNALPTGSQITSGQATISQNGAQMTINQSTNKLITNWQRFDIGRDASVQFNQPNSASVALNRIQSTDPTQIMGSLKANGQVYLLNPSGVIFGESARVDVGGLVASSLELADDDFNNGRANFTNGNTGLISNAGQIKTKDGGYVAFIAPQVENTGTISTPQGTTALISGNKVNLDFNGDKLITYSIEQGAIDAEINNQGLIQVDSGTVILSAQSANTLTQSVVNQTGVIEANSLVSKGGRILLEGDDITLSSTSKTNAKGATGGGEILIGGDWQGSGDIHQATTVTMESGAEVDASATDNGDGGKVVLWSDITDAQSVTEVHGEIKAQSGTNGGRGGKVETSGYALDVEGIEVSTVASDGSAGTWLLDPEAYNIAASGGDITGASIATSLLSTNVEIFGTGAPFSLQVNDDILYTGAGDRTLTLKAVGDINFYSGKTIDSSTGKLNVVFRGDTDNNLGDEISILGTINTNGGGLWVGAGANDTLWTPYAGATAITVGDIAITTNRDDVAGLNIDGANITTNGGNIKLWGSSNEVGDGNGFNQGVRIYNSNISSGAGNIDIIGSINGKFTNGIGVDIRSQTSALNIESITGNINITGAGEDTVGTFSGWRHGIVMLADGGASRDVNIKTVSGDITFDGTANFQNTTNSDSSGVQFQTTTTLSNINVVSQSGNINLLGTNTNNTQGTYTAGTRLFARDGANNIRIGYDGTNAYSGNILIQSDRIYQRSINAGAGSIAIQSTGGLTLESENANFSQSFTLDDDWNFGTTLGSFTVGKSTNAADIFLTDDITTTGAMTFYGKDIRTGYTLQTTGANADIKLLASGSIKSNGVAATFTTNGGNLLLASDTDNTNGGSIVFVNGFNVATNGGNITLAGGDISGSGYAQGSSAAGYDSEGVRIDGSLTLNSSGGDITLRGKSFAGTTPDNYGAWGVGLWTGTKSINSGTGNILFDGVSQSVGTGTYNNGVIIRGATTLQSSSSSVNAIRILGDAGVTTTGDSYGIEFADGVRVYATGGGGITLEADAGQLEKNLDFVFRPDTEILANSGAITLVGAEGKLWTAGSIYFGSKAGTPITTSSSDITIQSDTYNFNGTPVNINTSGVFTLESVSASFGQNINSNFFTYNATLGQTLGGFTVGKNTNTVDVFLTDDITTMGAITVYARDIRTANTFETTSANADIKFLASRDIYSDDTPGTPPVFITNGGNILLASDTDGVNGGQIDLRRGLHATSNGGDITLGGGDFSGSGYAQGYNTSNAVGIKLQGINTTSSIDINSNGGNIAFRGKSFAGTVASGTPAFGIGFWGATSSNFNSGTGTILFDGIGQSNGSNYGYGFMSQTSLGTTIQSANTSANAIRIIGDASASTSGVNDGLRVENNTKIYATGVGGGITLEGDGGSQNFDFTLFDTKEILANSGPINIIGKSTNGGQLRLNGTSFIGSRSGVNGGASSSDITLTADTYNFFGTRPNFNTSGSLTWNSASASFGQTISTSWFNYNTTLGQTFSGINIGKTTNTKSINIDSMLQATGDINVYGGELVITNDILSSGGSIALGSVAQASNSRGIKIRSGADIKTTGTGSITLTADARLADSDNNGYAIDIANAGTVIETVSGDITLTGTGTAVTGRTNSRGIVLQASDTEIRSSSGTITLRDINPNNASGTSSFYLAAGNKIGKGALASSSSNVFIEGDKLNLQGSIDTTGSLSLLSNGSTFLNGLTTSFSTSSVFSSLTIGKTTNTAGITLPNAYSTVGDITIYGGNINLNNTLSSSAGAVLAKATGNIISNGNDITSNGNITLWSDSDASGLGYISLAANSDLTSNGGDITLSGGADLITGYARANGAHGVSIGDTSSNTNNINSGGGDILIRGWADLNGGGNYQGISLHAGVNINSGLGAIGLYGKSDDHYAINIANSTNAGITFQSAKTTGTAITIDGQSTVDYGTVFNYDVNKQILASGGGDIAISGVAGANFGLFLSDVDLLATTGTITLDGGVRGITSGGSKPGAVIGQKTGSAITASSSDINIIGDVINFGSYTQLQSSGALDIHGTTAGTSIGLAGAAGALNIDATELGYIQNGFSSISFGDSASGQITSNAHTFADDLKLISGASGIQLTGALNVGANNLTLNSTGAVTQSTAITASGLELLNGSFTLNNTNNNVATLAANAGSINYVDSNALNIATVNTTGVNSTGTVSISTQSGDLTVSENIATSDTSNSAIILNAGKATAAGTTTGGNIIIAGGSTVSTGAGGRATLYSGSISGSTGLTNLIGSGTGRFRYGSDESATNYTSTLGAGKYAIYREQPTLTITAEDKIVTYGTAPVLTTSVSSQNGDTAGQALSTAATVSVGGTTSTSGNYTAGTSHTLTAAGAVDQLGYALSYNTGSLTVNKKNLTANYSGINKIYDASLSATAIGSSADIVGADIITFSEMANFLTKGVATGKTVNVSGIAIAGADANNYNLTSATASTTANITQKAVTVSGLTAANKTYDANTTAITDGSGVIFTGLIGGDALTLASLSGVFDDKYVGTGKTVALTSTYAGADMGNYAITDQVSTTANITQKAVTVSGIIAENKVFDGTTLAIINTTNTLFSGKIVGDVLSVSSTGFFVDSSIGIGKIVNLSNIYSGIDLANYSITDQLSTLADITAPPVIETNNIPSTLLLPPNSPNASSSDFFEAYSILQEPQKSTEKPLITIEKDNLHTGNNCINSLSDCEFYNLSLNDGLF